jgi:hypothetical protein
MYVIATSNCNGFFELKSCGEGHLLAWMLLFYISLPSSLLPIAFLAVIIFFAKLLSYEFESLAMNALSLFTMLTVLVVGYIQWFVIVPWLWRKRFWKKK